MISVRSERDMENDEAQAYSDQESITERKQTVV